MVIGRKLFLIVFLFVGSAASCFAQSDVEQKKIEDLIGEIANLHDARFIRNGSEYGVDQAVDHIRTKLRYAGSRVKTAEDFINYCATGSSVTGEKYLIRFGNGQTVESAVFLRGKLAEYRSK